MEVLKHTYLQRFLLHRVFLLIHIKLKPNIPKQSLQQSHKHDRDK